MQHAAGACNACYLSQNEGFYVGDLTMKCNEAVKKATLSHQAT